MTAMERPRPRWSHAVTGLRDFAIVTWEVEPARIRGLLPHGFEPIADDGIAHVSMVPFLDRLFRFRALPFVPVNCGQVNYRTYVRRGDETGVWFFGTALDSAFVAIPKKLWKMPWHRTTIKIGSRWDGQHCDRWEMRVKGRWEGALVVLEGSNQPLDRVTTYTPEASRAIFFDPFRGWYTRTDSESDELATYSVWHEPLRMERARVLEARSRVLTRLHLLEAGQKPIWAGIQRYSRFEVHTPPVRLGRVTPPVIKTPRHTRGFEDAADN